MNLRNILAFLLLTLITSCKKDWLEIKPDKKLVVPATLKDMQALLDNTDLFTGGSPGLGELGADNYFVTTTIFQGASILERNSYTWQPDAFGGLASISDWNSPYKQVYAANLVLEGLNNINITSANKLEWEQIKGTALFYRSYAFYNLAQVFAACYDPSSASTDLGIPLRLSSDVNEPTTRASLQETYNQINSDLKTAAELLPLTTAFKTQPSKPAAYALLARSYLSMSDFDNAEIYSNSCLSLYNTLLDYSSLNATLTYPVPQFNNEVIYHSVMNSYTLSSPLRAGVDTLLYQSYEPNDLRKIIFFKNNAGRISFNGSYHAGSILFNGLAVDEIYLIRAECKARQGNAVDAMDDLNKLLLKRWKAGSFVPLTAADGNAALTKILQERRKELLFRGLRWTDLRRFNKTPRLQTTLIRIVNGQTYQLQPNDQKYIYPIPDNEILISGIQQNPR